ncbi:hypothetical protein IE53DRAFT_91200 [Violaceomyces palustris]|uniref:Uncharacterized protein n=1 Tax=Violaceomyces palustris TaxID=1673888 RepID=A0ACD0NXH0_9BASI|nr:hypothetical protein IE53DRAFT_91200 [Violaceomyces palustris]
MCTTFGNGQATCRIKECYHTPSPFASSDIRSFPSLHHCPAFRPIRSNMVLTNSFSCKHARTDFLGRRMVKGQRRGRKKRKKRRNEEHVQCSEEHRQEGASNVGVFYCTCCTCSCYGEFSPWSPLPDHAWFFICLHSSPSFFAPRQRSGAERVPSDMSRCFLLPWSLLRAD